jgi:hypothetical protein
MIERTTRPPPIGPATLERVADLAKSNAGHWERKAAKKPAGSGRDRQTRDGDAKTKAGHWRIIEKEICALSDPCPSPERDV